MPARTLAAAAIVAILVLSGIVAVDVAYGASGPAHEIENETFTPADAGNVTQLDASELNGVRYVEATDVVVTDENGTHMVAGEDYEWVDANGTVRTLAGGRLVGDTTANATYGYAAPTSMQRSLAELFGGTFETARLLVLVLTVGFILVSIRALGAI